MRLPNVYIEMKCLVMCRKEGTKWSLPEAAFVSALDAEFHSHSDWVLRCSSKLWFAVSAFYAQFYG